MRRAVLPIDALLPEITHHLENNRCLVIEAPPGSGKTTRVPPALLSMSRGIFVLEPRRLAARMAAARVAAESGTLLGGVAGYQVRFENVSGPDTRIRFVTEGVLTRRFLSSPELKEADIVILDEFHERHLEGDLALALLRRLQLGPRPDLRLVVMSATLETGPLAAYLDGCPVVRSETRGFPVAIEYAEYSAAPVEDQVRNAIERLVPRLDGHILTFLPGAAEIRRTAAACEAVARRAGLEILPLHGDLTPAEQDRAVLPSARRKLILSTNVAESSITIEGVTTFIDSGLARIAGDSPFTGIPTLEVRRISQASAAQRAGRAGRTGPGRVIRLYSQEDYARRPAADVPEIRRRELSGLALQLRALSVTSPPWFDPPPAEAWARAEQLLDRLHADRDVTEMARLPVHPRLARLLLEAEARGVAAEGCAAAALITGGERYSTPNLLDELDGQRNWPAPARQAERQLLRLVRRRGKAQDPAAAISISVLAGYPDRACRRRSGADAQLASGESVSFPFGEAPPFFTAIDVENRSDQAAPIVRLCCPFKSEWLLDLFPERIRESTELVWNSAAERVEQKSALLYDQLAIEEWRDFRPSGEQVSALLARQAVESGPGRFGPADQVEALLARTAFAAEHGFGRALTGEDVAAALVQLSTGLASFADLREAASGGGLIRALRDRLPDGGRDLDEVAPERIAVSGRLTRVNYAPGQPPWVASRLQDLFGMREGPRVGRGRVPVLLHLLAPNQRPVQVTSDLSGFWTRLYPQIRKELSRRYPKHKWPEDPLKTPQR